ncbi:MAG: hypothetical protein KatS3mg087_0034 [Patescibacteria group bacterium]|nr:MAG: hypothetical protein KatS3mg087_0034 [Patescibacteria group bacterium]
MKYNNYESKYEKYIKAAGVRIKTSAVPDIYIFGIPLYGFHKFAASQQSIDSQGTTTSPAQVNNPRQTQVTTSTPQPAATSVSTQAAPGTTTPTSPSTSPTASASSVSTSGQNIETTSTQQGSQPSQPSVASTQQGGQPSQPSAAHSVTEETQEQVPNIVMTGSGPISVDEEDPNYKEVHKVYTEPSKVDSDALAPGVGIDTPPNLVPEMHISENIRMRYEGALTFDQFMSEQDPQKKAELFQKLPKDLQDSLRWLSSTNWKNFADLNAESLKVLEDPQTQQHFKTLWAYGLTNLVTKRPDGGRLDINNKQDFEQIKKNVSSVIARAFADDNEITIHDLNLLYNNFTKQLGLDPQDSQSAQMFHSMRETKQLTPFHNMALLFGLPIALGSIASILSGQIGILPVLGLMFGGLLSLFGSGVFERSGSAPQQKQQPASPFMLYNIGGVGDIPFIPTGYHRKQLELANTRSAIRQQRLQEVKNIAPEQLFNQTITLSSGQVLPIGQITLGQASNMLEEAAQKAEQGVVDANFVKLINQLIYTLSPGGSVPAAVEAALDTLYSKEATPQQKAEAFRTLKANLDAKIQSNSGIISADNFSIQTAYNFIAKK